MKLASTLMVLGLAAGASGALLFQGCGGDSSSDTGGGDGGGGGGEGGSGGGAGKRWPESPSGASATTSTDERNFAVKAVVLGEGTAWKSLGYDLDGKKTDKNSTDVCKFQATGSKSMQEDGNDGIDNSFGRNILPLIISAASGAPKALNDALTAGNFTIMFNVKGLSDDASQSATGLSGYVNAGGKFSETATPTFTPADDWPVRDEILSTKTDPTSSKIRFPSAYVNKGTFVSGTPSDVTVSLVFNGITLSLTVHKAVITFNHTAAAKAENGVIAGILNTTELLDGLKKVAGGISTSLCEGSAFDAIADQIKGASDIMSDGTNNAGSECDAISVALGFTAAQIGQPTKVAPPAGAPKDPCAK
jgi:hypothetical protein